MQDGEPAAKASQKDRSKQLSMSPPSKRAATQARASQERSALAAAEQPQHSEPVQEANDESEDEADDAADGEAEGTEGHTGSEDGDDEDEDDSPVGEPGAGKKEVRLKGEPACVCMRRPIRGRVANDHADMYGICVMLRFVHFLT